MSSQSGKREFNVAFPDTKEKSHKPSKKGKRSRPRAADKSAKKQATTEHQLPKILPEAAAENSVTKHESKQDKPKQENRSVKTEQQHKKSRPGKEVRSTTENNSEPIASEHREGNLNGDKSLVVIRTPSNVAQSKSSKHKNKNKHKHRKDKDTPKELDSDVHSDWELSTPSGGTFIDQDPILTVDGQHLILCTQSAVHIYSTQTSLLIRSLSGPTTNVASVALSVDHDHEIFVAYVNGSIRKYDWTTGRCLWSVRTKSRNSLAICHQHHNADTGSDEILCVSRAKTEKSAVVQLDVASNGNILREHDLLRRPSLYSPVICCKEDSLIVTCSLTHIFIGQLTRSHPSDSGKSEYNWLEVAVPGVIACFDARITKSTTKPKSKGDLQTLPSLNVAVGLKSGVVEVYTNILYRLRKQSGNDTSSAASLTARKEHWHRQQPNSLKFSPDGNYLVSGGEETVLMITQLDAGNRQFLPHLSSPILNITISNSGADYAIRLADNSVMVLSTADLKPSANVSGLACDISPYGASAAADRAVIHPSYPNTLVLASSTQATQPAPYPSTILQTYDTSAQLQLSRQALSRNLITTAKVGPNGQPLREPDVTHLKITHDGNWLITVDQWQPDSKSLRDLYLDSGDDAARSSKTECYLRFWSASTSSDTNSDAYRPAPWQLNTRIDDSCTSATNSLSPNTPPLLDLATSPTRLQVATADSSMHLKFFSPKARLRSGLPVLDDQSQPLYTWTCDRSIPLSYSTASSSPAKPSSHFTKHAALAYSDDGSVLAACWSAAIDEAIRVHLLDSKTGKLQYSLDDITLRGKPNLRFCGRYLCALSSKLVIFDTINMEKVFEVDLWEEFDTRRSLIEVNTGSKTVALAMNSRDINKPGRLVVYAVDDLSRGMLFDQEIKAQVRILGQDVVTGGFTVVDGRAGVRKVLPPSSVVDSSTALVRVSKGVEDLEKAIMKSGIDEMFGAKKDSTEASNAPTQPQLIQANGQSSLEEVLKFESTARAPAPSDLFARVARLIAGTPA